MLKKHSSWTSFVSIPLISGLVIHCRGRIGNTFDIANINLPDSAKRSQGLFKQLLEEIQNLLEEYPRIDAIYIESVINLRLEDYLRRSNFKEVILYPNSFYRLILNQKGERDAHV